MNSCAAVVGGKSIEGVDLSRQTVIEGIVKSASGNPIQCYVRLLDMNDEFVAEMPTDELGQFRFFAYAGNWRVKAITSSGIASLQVAGELGKISTVELNLN